MERNLAYGVRARPYWPAIVGVLRRDRVYLLKETRKIRKEINKKQQMITHPEICGMDLWYIKELHQELIEIKIELENLCD